MSAASWQSDATMTDPPSYVTTSQEDVTLAFDVTALLVGGGAPSAPVGACFVVADNAPDTAFTLQDQPALGTGNFINQRLRGLAAGTTYRYRLTFTTGGNKRSLTTIILVVE